MTTAARESVQAKETDKKPHLFRDVEDGSAREGDRVCVRCGTAEFRLVAKATCPGKPGERDGFKEFNAASRRLMTRRVVK